jgi:signal transduction histidine kinase
VSDPAPFGSPGELRFRALVDRCPLGVWNLSADGRTLYANDALRALLELDPNADLGATDLTRFFSDADLSRLAVLRAGTVRVGLRGARGTKRQVLCAVSEVVDADAAHATLRTFVDVTDLWREHERSQRAEKLEAIGRLAGGIAHDFNNLLMVMYTCAGLLERHLPPGPVARSYLEQIESAVKRGAELTRQVLAFAKQDTAAPTSVDVNEVVRSLVQMLARVIGDQIEVRANVDRSLHTVLANRGQLEQVLMNLALNARDAMPTGGKLVISTANVELAGDDARDLDVSPGDYVLMAVADTGHGMDAETKSRVFEPFFTTKAGGTGLGLATSFGIVRQSGGAITVESTPGGGSAFSVWLPVFRGPHPEARPSLAPRAPRIGKETVLLVDDEETIRRPLAEFLRLHGFTVLEAKNGVEALDHAERYEGPIHALVTDVVMPKMGGRPLADALRAARPEMRVLYLSGHSDSTIGRRGALEPGVAVLQKPFPPAALVSRIHDVIAGEASGPDT